MTIIPNSISLLKAIIKVRINVVVHYQHDSSSWSQAHHLRCQALVQSGKAFLAVDNRNRTKGRLVLHLSRDRLRTLRKWSGSFYHVSWFVRDSSKKTHLNPRFSHIKRNVHYGSEGTGNETDSYLTQELFHWILKRGIASVTQSFNSICR